MKDKSLFLCSLVELFSLSFDSILRFYEIILLENEGRVFMFDAAAGEYLIDN